MFHFCCWHKTDIAARADDVSSLGQSRHCGCERRDLILTRKYLRSSPRVGGGQIAGAMRGGDRWGSFIRKKLEFNPKSPPGRKSLAFINLRVCARTASVSGEQRTSHF